MAECRHLRLPFVMEYAAEHFSLDIAWPEQRLGIEVRDNNATWQMRARLAHNSHQTCKVTLASAPISYGAA